MDYSPDPLTPEQMTSCRYALGLGAKRMGNLLGVDERTIRRWESGERHIPGPVSILVDIIMKHEAVRLRFGVSLEGDKHYVEP